jgi:DNA-binding transcriptional regulator GbsR (MarR family)
VPGRRLTRRDRLFIAKGLVQGLDYAEIARRLMRPTSTISREVARNGGPVDYDPDQAHHATKRRVRRRRSGPDVALNASTARASRRVPDSVRAFEGQFATTLVRTGMTRMPARVLAALHITDDGSLTAAELGQHLKVSSASISKAVAYLEDQGMVRRERIPRRRAERYVVDPDAWFQALLASAERNRELAGTAGEGARLLGPTTPAGSRLAALSHFHRHLTEEITNQAHEWRQTLDDTRPAENSPQPHRT